MLKPEEIAQFRTLLVNIQSRIRGDVEQLRHESLDAIDQSESHAPNHPAELGTDAYERDFAIRFIESDQETLKEISAALARIEAGTFGECEMCHEEGREGRKANIPKARLKAIPFARNCIECERRREEENAH